jgi:hypothetical protein
MLFMLRMVLCTLRYRDFTLKGTQLLFAFSGTFNRFDIQAFFV